MIVTLQTAGLQTLALVRVFIEGNEPILFTLTDRAAAHQWMAQTLGRFGYRHCSPTDQVLLRGATSRM